MFQYPLEHVERLLHFGSVHVTEMADPYQLAFQFALPTRKFDAEFITRAANQRTGLDARRGSQRRHRRRSKTRVGEQRKAQGGGALAGEPGESFVTESEKKRPLP